MLESSLVSVIEVIEVIEELLCPTLSSSLSACWTIKLSIQFLFVADILRVCFPDSFLKGTELCAFQKGVRKTDTQNVSNKDGLNALEKCAIFR